MTERTDVPPATVGVSLLDHGVEVEYLDGRRVLYRGVPEPVAGDLTTAPGRETHVLVTDPTETEGVLVYVNDRKTAAEVLEDSGVGRVVLSSGESTELFPGVRVRRTEGRRTVVVAEPETARGRVFVFAEDDWHEESYELVAAEEADDAADAVGGGG